MKKIYDAADPVHARLLSEILSDNGIESVVRDERLFALRGSLPIIYPSVWVSEDDVEKARAHVAQFEAGPATKPQGQTWTCPKCGEKLEAQFTECWRCSAGDAAPIQPASLKPAVKVVISIIVFIIVTLIILYLLFPVTMTERKPARPVPFRVK